MNFWTLPLPWSTPPCVGRTSGHSTRLENRGRFLLDQTASNQPRRRSSICQYSMRLSITMGHSPRLLKWRRPNLGVEQSQFFLAFCFHNLKIIPPVNVQYVVESLPTPERNYWNCSKIIRIIEVTFTKNNSKERHDGVRLTCQRRIPACLPRSICDSSAACPGWSCTSPRHTFQQNNFV